MPDKASTELARYLGDRVREAQRTRDPANNFSEEWIALRVHQMLGYKVELLEAENEELRSRLQNEKDYTLRLQRQVNRANKPAASLVACCFLCASVSLWLFLTTPSAQAAPILALATDAPSILHRGDVFTATVYLASGSAPPAEPAIGVDWSLAFPGVFHVLSRDLADSPFTDPLSIDPTPGGVDLGATVTDVAAPAPPGCWTLAILRVQVDASAPAGAYDLTTISPSGSGFVGPDFTDQPFAFHTTWPIEISNSQISNAQIPSIPEPAVAMLLAALFLVIEFGFGPRRPNDQR